MLLINALSAMPLRSLSLLLKIAFCLWAKSYITSSLLLNYLLLPQKPSRTGLVKNEEQKSKTFPNKVREGFCIAPPKKISLQIRQASPNTCRFQFAAQLAPTLSMTAIVLAVYFFNLRLIPYIPTMPFQKIILCYNSIGSRRRLTILVLAEVQLWK